MTEAPILPNAQQALDHIKALLAEDLVKLDELITKYPIIIPNHEAAAFLNVSTESYNAFLESGALGMAWRKEGKLNKARKTLTKQFVRWYLMVNPLEDVNS